MTTEKKPRKAVNSKAKGSGFENTLAKKLSEALDPLKFIRTQGSGARVGGKNFATIGQLFGEDALKLFVGDVVPVNEKEAGVTFRFSIEAKFYKTPDNFPSLVTGNANFFKWFDESVTDAVKIDKIPALIFKWNNTPIFVGVPTGTPSPIKARVTISKAGVSIDVYDFSEIVNVKEFWVV